ncbi:MAG: heavy metal translocating P-type ATPase [Anaerovoracaceae bacterium]
MRGVLTVEVTKLFGESTVSKILDLVENAANKKSKMESFISRFAAVYTPLVVGAAVLLAILPPLLVDGLVWSEWIKRPLNFLVVSCPCALVISVPLSFFGGIGGASKAGVLVKGSNYLEAMSHAEYVVMDKTGTLTEGKFSVEDIAAEEGFNREQLLEYAAMAENYSNHPISQSLRNAYGREIDQSQVDDVSEIAGKGVVATVKGHRIAVETESSWPTKQASKEFKEYENGTQVMVAVDGVYGGCILLADRIKEDSADAVSKLRSGRSQDGDAHRRQQRNRRKSSRELGIDKVYAGLLPADKVDIVEELIKSKSSKGKLVFVGDGINDAPVLARADVGVAMGALGSDAAIEAADMVIMNDQPSKLAQMMSISKKTMTIVKENIIFALGVKAAVLVLSALGLVGMWAAVFADVGVSMIAIINALRCLSTEKLS